MGANTPSVWCSLCTNGRQACLWLCSVANQGCLPRVQFHVRVTGGRRDEGGGEGVGREGERKEDGKEGERKEGTEGG